MDLTIAGCSGSFPGPDSAASCYLITADGFRLVMDLGNGGFGALQRFADPAGIDAVLISHLHGDHCLDLCSYQVFRDYGAPEPLPPIPVYAPAGAAARLDRAAAVDRGQPVSEAFRFRELGPGRIEIGPLTVTAAPMNHPVPTFGFRLEHGGRVFAYSADTGPCDELVSLAAGADLLLCEATFRERPGLPGDLHLTPRQAGQHAARAGAGQLVLTHLTPGTDGAQARQQAEAAFGGDVSLAVPGRKL
ncbi:MAG: MBL fold metallo-hydrolase [Streptosporangiaceae bacterium]